MNRSLAISFTAICVAGSFPSSASAGPTLPNAESLDGVRSSDSRTEALPLVEQDSHKSIPITPSSTTVLPDVTDFISPTWRDANGQVRELSQQVPDIALLLEMGQSPTVSSEMNALSVPEIPLPLNVIPGLVGVVAVLIVHRRSLKNRNLPK